MASKKAYIIAFRRSDFYGTEEYDGGYSIADARKEAAFFVENLPSHVQVRICKVDRIGNLSTVEYAPPKA